MGSLPLLHLLIQLLSLFTLVVAVKQIRVVDDQQGNSDTFSLSYVPADQWSPHGNGNPPCGPPNCNLVPNSTLAYNGTWHDTTRSLSGDYSVAKSIKISFIGVALRIFCILPSKSAQATKNTNLIFTLDGQNETFQYDESQLSDDYQYNISVFAAIDLVNTNHTFIMQTSTDNANAVLFDYAEYTYDDEGIIESSRTSSKSKTNLPAILGGVLGSLLFLCLSTLLVLYARKRRAEIRSLEAGKPDPYSQHHDQDLSPTITSPTDTGSFIYTSHTAHTRDPSNPTITSLLESSGTTAPPDSGGPRSVVPGSVIDYDQKGPPPAYTAS